jgi:hypothetical protein
MPNGFGFVIRPFVICHASICFQAMNIDLNTIWFILVGVLFTGYASSQRTTANAA